MHGGRIVSDEAVFPTGFTRSHQFVCEREAPVFLNIPVILTVSDIKQNRMTVHLRRDTAVMTELPRIQVIDPANDPLITGGAPLYEVVMSAGVGEWETINFEWLPPRTGNYVIRICGQNTAGNFWAQWEVPAFASPVVAESLAVNVAADSVIAALIEDVITVEVTD
jgi:hypothetical protein